MGVQFRIANGSATDVENAMNSQVYWKASPANTFNHLSVQVKRNTEKRRILSAKNQVGILSQTIVMIRRVVTLHEFRCQTPCR